MVIQLDAMAAKSRSLLLTDLVAVPIGAVLSAIKDVGSEIVSEDDVLVITQGDSLGKVLYLTLFSFVFQDFC